jgi:hypothetical protein
MLQLLATANVPSSLILADMQTRKFSPYQDSNSDPLAVEPVACRYTDCATVAPRSFSSNSKILLEPSSLEAAGIFVRGRFAKVTALIYKMPKLRMRDLNLHSRVFEQCLIKKHRNIFYACPN